MPPGADLDFEELDYQPTPLGDLCLRRRTEPRLAGAVVYEVKLGDEFLMSSLFTVGERALAERGLAVAPEGELDVVVGGLGLGYTAVAALDHPRLRSLLVIEALAPVIDWHRRSLVPLGARLCGEPRSRLVEGDFFALTRAGAVGFDPQAPGRRFHAVLLDIDHSPRHLLHAGHAAFYQPSGLAGLAAHLHPGGVFALWSNDRPDVEFERRLSAVFEHVQAEVVEFPNPYQGTVAACTVYVAKGP